MDRSLLLEQSPQISMALIKVRVKSKLGRSLQTYQLMTNLRCQDLKKNFIKLKNHCWLKNR